MHLKIDCDSPGYQSVPNDIISLVSILTELKDWASVGRLDWIIKQQDMAYSLAKNLRDTWKADTKMISFTKKDKNKRKQNIVKKIMKTKKALKL